MNKKEDKLINETKMQRILGDMGAIFDKENLNPLEISFIMTQIARMVNADIDNSSMEVMNEMNAKEHLKKSRMVG